MRVAIIDRHPAMRAGLEAILGTASDIEVVAGTGDDRHELTHALYRTAPDVVMVEDAPGRVDGVGLAREIKSLGLSTRVLVHADRPDAVQVATALLAEDHAILAMRLAATPRREISDTLRIDPRALRRRVAAMITRLRSGAVAALGRPVSSATA